MLSQLKQTILKKIEKAKDLKSLEDIYRRFLGRKGELTGVLRSLKDLPEKERREKGRLATQIKQEIEEKLKIGRGKFQVPSSKFQEEWIDITAPGLQPTVSHLHPITQIRQKVEEIFQSMGFSVVEGPEIETEYYNFDALNIPKEHPARDLWDTFWLKRDVIATPYLIRGKQSSRKQLTTGLPRGFASRNDGKKLLLRAHTSPVQIRYMETHQPPLRIIAPGRCFRHEATDASHDVQFYQVEGLMVGKDISVANFRGILQEFFKRFFGPEIKMRLRPSYFPFVEPGFEVDILKNQKSKIKNQKEGEWLELMGAGMVHPNVFKAVGYNPRDWQGFAFGMGLDRLAMLKYKIEDIRLFYSGDLRFLKQF